MVTLFELVKKYCINAVPEIKPIVMTNAIINNTVWENVKRYEINVPILRKIISIDGRDTEIASMDVPVYSDEAKREQINKKFLCFECHKERIKDLNDVNQQPEFKMSEFDFMFFIFMENDDSIIVGNGVDATDKKKYCLQIADKIINSNGIKEEVWLNFINTKPSCNIPNINYTNCSGARMLIKIMIKFLQHVGYTDRVYGDDDSQISFPIQKPINNMEILTEYGLEYQISDYVRRLEKHVSILPSEDKQEVTSDIAKLYESFDSTDANVLLSSINDLRKYHHSVDALNIFSQSFVDTFIDLKYYTYHVKTFLYRILLGKSTLYEDMGLVPVNKHDIPVSYQFEKQILYLVTMKDIGIQINPDVPFHEYIKQHYQRIGVDNVAMYDELINKFKGSYIPIRHLDDGQIAHLRANFANLIKGDRIKIDDVVSSIHEKIRRLMYFARNDITCTSNIAAAPATSAAAPAASSAAPASSAAAHGGYYGTKKGSYEYKYEKYKNKYMKLKQYMASI